MMSDGLVFGIYNLHIMCLLVDADELANVKRRLDDCYEKNNARADKNNAGADENNVRADENNERAGENQLQPNRDERVAHQINQVCLLEDE